MKLISFILFSLFSLNSFSGSYRPTRKEFIKMEKELEKGKTKTFDSWLAKGLDWKMPSYGEGYEGSFWESVPGYVNSYPKNDVGWYVFTRMLEIGADINWHDGLGSVMMETAATFNPKVINEMLKRGSNYKLTLTVEHNGQILKRNVLTALSSGGINKFYTADKYFKTFDFFVQNGVGVCDDDGEWADHVTDPAKNEAIDKQYDKYCPQMVKDGCVAKIEYCQ